MSEASKLLALSSNCCLEHVVVCCELEGFEVLIISSRGGKTLVGQYDLHSKNSYECAASVFSFHFQRDSLSFLLTIPFYGLMEKEMY